jgi:hypothetical protein
LKQPQTFGLIMTHIRNRKPKTEMKHLGASGASADRALRGSALSRSGPSAPGRAALRSVAA